MRPIVTLLALTALLSCVNSAASAQSLQPGLIGHYYKHNGKTDAAPAKVKPFLVRVDKQVNFKEAGGEFYGSKLADGFMVRWSGVLRVAKAGAYTFYTHSDDGSRLYINGKLVVENWGPHSMTKKTGNVELAAGDHDILITYQEGGGGAGCIAGWSSPALGIKEQPLPANVLLHDSATAKAALAVWDKDAWVKFKAPPKKQSAGGGGGVAYRPTMGPVVRTAIHLGNDEHGPNVVYRGIVIPLNEDASAGVVFDADTMRMAAGWTNGDAQLVLNGLPFTGGHGAFPRLDGDKVFSLHATPGWAGPNGKLDDPREGEYPPLGNLPKDWARFLGIVKSGWRVNLLYVVGRSASIMETPTLVARDGYQVLNRTVHYNALRAPTLTLVLADAPGATIDAKGRYATVPSPDGAATTMIGLADAPSGAHLKLVNKSLVAVLPDVSGKGRFAINAWRGPTPKDGPPDKLLAVLNTPAQFDPYAPLKKAIPPIWPDVIETQAELASDKESKENAYVVDRVTVPFKNKYESRMRIGGMDFFKDGKRAAVSTWDGDVWIVSGLAPGKQMSTLKWKRFATGLHEPLGLKIVDDEVYVVDDAQITHLRDIDKNGEADYYVNFNSDWQLTSGFHAFCFDLHTDKAGNFYFAFGSPVRPGGGSFQRIGEHHGSILRVSPDGKKLERYATGLRAPNGIGVGPDGRVTSGDNEGTFVPRCPIHWIDQGEFLGVVDSAEPAIRKKLNTTPTVSQLSDGRPRKLDPSEAPLPLAWLPKHVDNSGGGQVWATSDKWGPLNGVLLHMSYGRSALYLVLKDDNLGVMQGGVVAMPLPQRFTSSAMRARVNPMDGQLYVAGLRGWQSNAAKEGGFDRVRYTGQPVRLPRTLKIKPDGIVIGFTCKLDPKTAGDAERWGLKGADIRWSHGYGSSEYELGQRGSSRLKKGWTELDIESVTLGDDGKTVFLEVLDIQPAHLMAIQFNIKSTGGRDIRGPIYNTVHKVE